MLTIKMPWVVPTGMFARAHVHARVSVCEVQAYALCFVYFKAYSHKRARRDVLSGYKLRDSICCFSSTRGLFKMLSRARLFYKNIKFSRWSERSLLKWNRQDLCLSLVKSFLGILQTTLGK